jgi:hypothetical protein
MKLNDDGGFWTIKDGIFELHVGRSNSLDFNNKKLDLPEWMSFNGSYTFFFRNFKADDLSFINKNSFPSLINFGFSKYDLKSWDNLPDTNLMGRGIFMDGSLPKTNWRAVMKYNLKSESIGISISPVSQDKTRAELSEAIRESKTLLEFQSRLIDADLESYF